MKRRRYLSGLTCLLLGALLMFLMPGYALAADDPVTVSITAPRKDQPVDGKVTVEANTTSVNEMKEVKAVVGDTEALLTPSCSGPYCSWTGELPLDGTAKGPQTLTVTATDIDGQTGSSAVGFLHDSPPVVTLAEPADQAVIEDGLLHIVLEAEDDMTSAPLEYMVSVGTELNYPFFVDSAGGADRFDRVIDVSEYGGDTLYIWYKIGDLTTEYGEPLYRTSFLRQVYVEPVWEPDPVTVSITAPRKDQPVDGKVTVEANTTSVNEMKEVKAVVGDTEALLTPSCSGPYCSWAGELPLDGIAKGPQTLTVTATDIDGQTGSSAVGFRHDSPPVVTLAEPADQAVIEDGLLHIVLEAEDDMTSAPLEYMVSVGTELNYPFFVDSARGADRFDRVIDVSEYGGDTLYIWYKIGDLTTEYGEPLYRTSFLRQVYVKPADGELRLSDSKTYEADGSNYEFLLYYGYISSPGQELSGSWSPPEGFHGVVQVSMVSPGGENYDLGLEAAGEGNRLREDTTELPDGAEYGAIEVPEGYTAEWRVKGHTDKDYSRDRKTIVYVSIKYDND